MSTKTTGGPAFPTAWDEVNRTTPDPGMNLRDYFAAKSLQGMMANETIMTTFAKESRTNKSIDSTLLAELCYNMADSMLKEREK